jgi:CheY-like chemotaxis protein
MPTLLLSDENATVQRMMAMTFAAEDITVTTVSDGEQAIARITRERPDIVLAGTTTPKRTGYEVAAFIKSDPVLSSIPVLLLTGAFEPVDEVRVAQVRCDGVLVKPLEPQHVIARVRELLSGASRATQAATPGVLAVKPAVDVIPESLDAYFERLDAAFGARSTASAPRIPADGHGPSDSLPTADSGAVPTVDSVLNTPAAAPATAPADRAPLSAAAAAEPAVTDALVDEVTRRVVERGDRRTRR